MTGAQLERLESFAAARLSSGDQSCIVQISEVPTYGWETDQLLSLISEYELLPSRQQKYMFAASPAAILIVRAIIGREDEQ